MSSFQRRRPTPRRLRPRIDTSMLAHPKPGDKAKAMLIEHQEFAKKREPSAELRRAVFARDNGVCGLCGLDTEALANQWVNDLKVDLANHDCNICGLVTPSVPCIHCNAVTCSRSTEQRTEYRAMLEELGFPREFSRKYNGATLWQADHVLAVHEDGGGLGVENGRTLCIRCHVAITAEQATTRALRRRHAR